MSEFDQFGRDLHQLRLDKTIVQRRLLESQEKIKRLQADRDLLQRSGDLQNLKDAPQLALLDRRLAVAESAVEQARGEHSRLLDLEQSAFRRFAEYTDPRKQIIHLDDQYPILLMPLRIETRWRVQEQQLWVRVYPDDVAIDSFEPTLSEVEVKSGQRFWAGMWAAGGVEAQQRAAWRGLVASHGTGRAAWIKQQYPPLNPSQPVKASPEDEILVIATANPPSDADAEALTTYWKAVWLANGNVTALSSARAALVGVIGEEHAAELIQQYTPQNIDDIPATKREVDVRLAVEFLRFPKPDDTPTKRNSWSQPARTHIMPERLVLLGYQDHQNAPVINELGNPIPSPLILTPDPSAASADQLHLENGDLVVSDAMRWVVDFERAVSVGMGFKINLSPAQWTRGLSRLLVIGVRLSGGAPGGKTLLETLINDHHYSAKGISLLPQGTPTNNTDTSGAGYSRVDDPDDTFDNYVQGKVFFKAETDPLLKKDGQWLAEALGVSYETLRHIPSTDQTDQAEAFAMNTALYPATLGYLLETMIRPGVPWDQVDDVRWFFRNFVSGRGQVPAVRIGNQPYGILPTTAYSRMKGFDSARLPVIPGQIEPVGPFLHKLHEVLDKLNVFWKKALGSVAHVDAEPGEDAHQVLLSILGLQPSSVDYYSRLAKSVDHLFNLTNLQDHGAQFMTAYRTLIFGDRGTDITTADRTLALLREYGFTFNTLPDVLELIFNRQAQKLKGPVIDDRPLSETALIRDYAMPQSAGRPNRNYLHWLVDVAQTSFEALRTESGFIGNKTPTALLYIMLRFALMQSYWRSAIEFHRSTAATTGFEVERVRSEPRFINIKQSGAISESRFAHLYTPLAGVTDPVNPTATLASAIPGLLAHAGQTLHLREAIQAVQSLANVPTARLERLFAEHIDLCSYRLDAWQQGLVRYQLTALRTGHYNPKNETPGGVYIGAYGWLENLVPENKTLTPVHLSPDLKKVFDPPIEVAPAPTPVMRDPTNEGYIHAPSLNHAVTAAVLRNGYNATADPNVRQAMAVNLSSERVRLALSFIEGIRSGQSLSALLGYQLERALHDGESFATVDQFIYPLRKEFPLQAGKLKLPINPATGAADPDLAPIETQEARNVVDGLALINHIKQTGNATYPFGRPELPLTQNATQVKVINDSVNRLLDIHDALADLALAEGVHQVVQGNYDRAAATMDAYSRGNFPPIPDVVQTPRTGITLTHRVGLHFEPGLDLNASPVGGISMTPRAMGEPAVNRWISSVLPQVPADVLCNVIITDPVTGAQAAPQVSWENLQVQPLDLLYLVQPENQQAMSELDDRIIRHIMAADRPPRPDAKIEIRYAEHIASKYSFFEIAPLMQSLRALLLASRPLQPTDVMLTTEAKQSQDDPVTANRPRLEHVCGLLDTLHTDLVNYVTPLQAIFDDLDHQRAQWLANVDTLMNDFNKLLARASSFGLPQTGWGFTYSWKAATYGGLIDQLKALVDRWTKRLTDFDTAMTNYAALPGTMTDEERFEVLQRAELLISTTLTDPRPASLTSLEAALTIKRDTFDTKRGQFTTLLNTTTTSLTELLNDVIKALLPINAFDSAAFDTATVENQIVTFCSDLLRVAIGVRDDADKRLKAAQDQFKAHTNAATSKAQVEALKQAAIALLGEDFRIIPEFTLLAEHGNEWEKAYAAGTNGDLLKYQTDPLPTGLAVEFPVDDWLYGVARVRDKLHHWERIVMLSGAFSRPEPEFTPIQLPYRNADRWLALEYPNDPQFVVDSERLLYTAHYPRGFAKASAQCGILLDEWTEILPLGQETTGLTFHYDRPSTEPPQVMLLVTSPQLIGSWLWDDLVAALHETLDLAKQRAVEPTHLEGTPLNRLLPATLMALTLREVSISGDLSINNQAL